MKRTLCLLLALMLALTFTACGDKEDDAATAKRGNRIGDLAYTTLTEIDQNGYTDHTFVGAISYETLLSAIQDCR